MTNIKLSQPGIYVPENIPINVITNQDLERIVDTSDEWITSRTGMKERRISHDKNVREMAVLAVKNLLAKTNTNPEEIDEIIFATNRHDNEQEFPNHANYVVRMIGARDGIPAYDQGVGCSGLLFAIRSGYNSMIVENKNKVIAIGSERLTDMTDYFDRNTCVLFGDGAGAYLLFRSEEEGIIKNVVYGRPDKGDNKDWKNGYLALERKKGLKIKIAEDQSRSKFEIYEKEQNYLVMKGNEIFEFASKVMRSAIHDVVKGTNYKLEDIDVIIPHGANSRIIRSAKEGLEKKGFRGQVITNLEKYGNTSTASVALAEAEAIEQGLIKPNSLVARVVFGAGFSWAANLSRS